MGRPRALLSRLCQASLCVFFVLSSGLSAALLSGCDDLSSTLLSGTSATDPDDSASAPGAADPQDSDSGSTRSDDGGTTQETSPSGDGGTTFEFQELPVPSGGRVTGAGLLGG